MFRRDVRMATDARIGPVRRGRQFDLIDEQRNRFSGGIGFRQRIVPMAIQAVGIFEDARI
jgi:hypothetical protein